MERQGLILKLFAVENEDAASGSWKWNGRCGKIWAAGSPL